MLHEPMRGVSTNRRLHNHGISHPTADPPAETVAWMGAMQAQEYASAKWAIGLRCAGATDATVEQAIADGSVVRTWLLRGTLHFVAAQDVRWMLALLAPRLIANSARRYAQLGLDASTLARSLDALTSALADNRQLTRAQTMQVLEQAGISTEGQRGYHILRHAGLEGLTCFAAKQGRQETFALLDGWAPSWRELGR